MARQPTPPTGGGDGQTAGWSAWKPSGAKTGTAQIAEHVGGQYRLPDGRQLVLVEGGPMEVAGLPLTVALRQAPAQGGDIKLFEDKGVLYRLCGLGKDCAITAGKPSRKRHLLLRREALELALYSFRYLDGVQQVAVFLPPALGAKPSQAVFLRKDQVREELSKPLDSTLTAAAPTLDRVTHAPDALLVHQLTLPALFRFSVTQETGDDRTLLMLDPLSAPQTPAPSGLPA